MSDSDPISVNKFTYGELMREAFQSLAHAPEPIPASLADPLACLRRWGVAFPTDGAGTSDEGHPTAARSRNATLEPIKGTPGQQPAPDEGQMRVGIREALGDIYRAHWTPGGWDILPANKDLVAKVLERLPGSSQFDADRKRLFYRLAVDEIDDLRLRSFQETAVNHADQSTRSSAGQKADRLTKLRGARRRLEAIDALMGEIYLLGVGAGLEAETVAALVGTSDRAVERKLLLASVEIDLIMAM